MGALDGRWLAPEHGVAELGWWPDDPDPDPAPHVPGRDGPGRPAADNEQLFVALRYLGREMEYVLYPESWHTFAITARSPPDRPERARARLVRSIPEAVGRGSAAGRRAPGP